MDAQTVVELTAVELTTVELMAVELTAVELTADRGKRRSSLEYLRRRPFVAPRRVRAHTTTPLVPGHPYKGTWDSQFAKKRNLRK